jgi:hypothetical protein
MTCYIKKIVVFGEGNEKREVNLSNGLNIVTGTSKKGKSALIEIVDYCLCASIPSIPKGTISKFAELFCIVLKINKNFLVIARPYLEENQSKIYVAFETTNKFLKSFDRDYFKDKTLLKIKGAGQENIEKYLGLNVSNSNISDEIRNKGKASLRNMTPFLYQYQNLIASKHALFSKLDDYSKRTAILEQIPIFLGIADNEFYAISRRIDEIIKQLSVIDRDKTKATLFNKQYEARLEGLLRNYFSFAGKDLPSFNSLSELISLALNLPEFSELEPFKTDSTRLYNELRLGLSEQSLSLSKVNQDISDIEKVASNAKKSLTGLSNIKSKVEHSERVNCACPVCGSDVEELNEVSLLMNSAIESLNTEVRSMINFSRFDSEHLESLKSQKRIIQKKISELNIQINEFEEYNEKLKIYKDKRDTIGFLRAKIEVIVEQISNKIQVTDYGEEELYTELKGLKSALGDFDYEREIRDCQQKLNTWINSVVSELDFEEEFLPTNITLDLKTLSMIHQDPKFGKVKLSDLGSGANWLAFHLGASLAFQRLFLHKKNSSVPNFLFLDQPSQVYFPRDFESDEDNDIKKVENIFNRICSFSKENRAETGEYAQIIVLDHADKLELGEYYFARYVRANWYGEHALI